MDAREILRGFYAGHEEDSRLATRAGGLEWAVTTRYIDRYLRRGGRILDIGCGTGRYALHYARKGHDVDALDLIEENLSLLKRALLPGDRVRAALGNALDLSAYPDAAYDVTLVLGPMYHLFTEEEKRRCLAEAMRVTKPGGHLFVAYCQFDAAMVQTAFSRGMLADLIERGLLDGHAYRPISNPAGVFELCRREDVDALVSELPAERLHYVGTDMFAHYHRDVVEGMDDAAYRQYVEYTLTICENPHLTGVSNHALDVLRKWG